MEIRVFDFGFDITFNVKNPDGTAFDLAGVAEVRFQVATSVMFRNIVDSVATITDVPTGQVKYTVQAEDFKKAGNYVGALKLVYSASKIVTTKNLHITVLEKLQ